MKLLPLRGKHAVEDRTHAMVDDHVFEQVSKLNWYLNRTDTKKPGCRPQYYVMTSIGPYRIYLHRLLMGLPDECVDHIDGNSLNNQMSNLRHATRTENARNRKSRQNSASKFRGVSWDSRVGKWRACIYVDNYPHFLGLFKCEICAARTYDSHAKHYYGSFARLNFPEKVYS